MTDLQVKWQTLQEQKRANQAQEDIKRQEAQTHEFQAQLESQQVPARIAQLISSADLNAAQQSKVLADINKISAEIANINADTSLTNMEKRYKLNQILASGTSTIGKLVGADTGWDLVMSIFGGAGKSVGSAIKSLFA